jgi:hypothetical protein
MLRCPICSLEFKKIDTQHLKKHGHTVESYLHLYPDGPIGACKETKQKQGEAVRARGQRSEETRQKISKNLKGKSKGRVAGTYTTSEETKAKQSESRKKFYKENGVSQEWAANISKSLKQKFADSPRQKMDRESDSYKNRLQIIRDLADRKKIEAAARLESELQHLDWADVLHITAAERVTVSCRVCLSQINRQIQTYRKHQFQPSLCHTCFPPLRGTSAAEEEIADFLYSIGLNPERHVRGVLPNNLELDFYLPDKKIAIEYHGLYWHSTAMDYPKDKHRRKYEECRNRGIHLVQIFEDEWVNKNDIVKSRLASLFRKQKSTVFARKCTVKEISSRDASAFLDLYHLQGGAARTKINFGIFHDSVLLGVATFQKPRVAMNQSREEGTYELVRFSTLGQIPGAFSKLLQYAIKTLQCKRITSWADLRWSNCTDNVYIRNGFMKKSESPVGYSYTDLARRYHRYGCRKPTGYEGTELQWNEQNKRYAIYDAGTINYVLEITNIK